MTEQEWLVCTKPKPMLRLLLGTDHPRVQDVESFPSCRGSGRKMRLFACACYHRIRHLLPDPVARAAVEVAERFADGMEPMEKLNEATTCLREPLDAIEGPWRASRGANRMALLPTHEALALALQVVRPEAPKAAYYASSNAYLTAAAIAYPGVATSDSGFYSSQAAEERVQCDLLRCIFGLLPFHSVTLNPGWRTATVKELAEAIYQERAFDRLPILADALEDAGCASQELLGHLRGGGEHCRGCWPLDLILGNE